MTRVRRLVQAAAALCALAIVLPSAALAQTEEPEIQLLSVDNTQHPRIELLVAIPPEMGDGPLVGTDFALTEAGNPRPALVQAERDSIEVVITIDTSGSMRPGDALGRAKEAAKQLVNGLPETARIGVVGFGSTVLVASPLSTDRAVTNQAIDSLTFSGDTALWDALAQSSQLFDPAVTSGRYVVILSDGVDDGSVTSQADALAQLQGAGTSLYAIGLNTGSADFTALEASVATVGGGFDTAEDTDALGALYASVAARLASRYRLLFDAGGTGEQEMVIAVATTEGLATLRQVIDLGGTPVVAATPSTVRTDFPAELRSSVAPRVLGLGRGWSLYLGAGTFFGAFALLAYGLLRPETRVRLATSSQAAGPAVAAGVGGLPQRITSATDRALAGSDRGSQLDRTLDSAGMEMRPGELVVLVAVLTVIVGLGLGAVTTYFVGLLAAIFVPVIAWLVVARKLRKRREAFGDQLGDTLTILAGALRAGRGLPQALELIAEEADSPTRDEFRRVIIESRVGRDITQSLMDVGTRMKNEDFGWLAEAVGINRELGGDLAEVLDNIGSIVRDRNKLKMQVRALSAEGRLSGYILVAIPVLIFGYISAVNPGYSAELLHGTGLVMLIVGIVAIGLGGLWIRNLAKLNY